MDFTPRRLHVIAGEVSSHERTRYQVPTPTPTPGSRLGSAPTRPGSFTATATPPPPRGGVSERQRQRTAQVQARRQARPMGTHRVSAKDTSKGLSLQQLIDMGLLGDQSGAGAARTAADYQSELRLQAQLQHDEAMAQWERDKQDAQANYQRELEMWQRQRDWEAQQEQARREAEEKARVEQLKAERQRIFVDMLGNDPVRAVLFALGVGGQILPEGQQFQELGALEGAEAKKKETEQSLTGALRKFGGGDPNAGVSIGNQGVSGLGSVENMARLLQQGTEDEKKLALSGLKLGGPGAGSTSQADALQRAQDVTPTGIFKSQ